MIYYTVLVSTFSGKVVREGFPRQIELETHLTISSVAAARWLASKAAEVRCGCDVVGASAPAAPQAPQMLCKAVLYCTLYGFTTTLSTALRLTVLTATLTVHTPRDFIIHFHVTQTSKKWANYSMLRLLICGPWPYSSGSLVICFQNPRKAARARRRDPEYREQYDTGATTRAWLVAGSSPVGASCDRWS